MSEISKNILINALKVTGHNTEKALDLVSNTFSANEMSKAKAILKKEKNLGWHNINRYI